MMRATAILATVLTLALAGCGSSGGTPATQASSASASLTDAEKQEQGHQFAQCMRDHGVQLEDPAPGNGISLDQLTGASSDATTRAALDACRQYLPNGGEPPKISAEDLAQGRKYAKCMRENGMPDFPDPDPDGQRIDVNPKDPKFKGADAACASVRPGANQGSGVGK